MINLAGNTGCDNYIYSELNTAGIKVVQLATRLRREVPASLEGQLTKDDIELFSFSRQWYYWSVGGYTPLAIAEELYANPIGKRDIRVAGHAGCPPPKEWAIVLSPTVTEILDMSPIQVQRVKKYFEMRGAGKIEGNRCVTSYHIDSQEGLNLFVSTLKKYGIVD